jgi:hypothetical protein
MADENPMGKSAAEPPTPQAEDLRDQALVLMAVLDNWPTHLTAADLIREIVGEPTEFAQCDRVNRAVRDLVGVGLALSCEEAVLPSRAAIRFERLAEL